MSALLAQMKGEKTADAETITTPNNGDYETRDVVAMAQGQELEVTIGSKDQALATPKTPVSEKTAQALEAMSGKVTIVGDTVLKVREDLSPQDLKYVPHKTDYIDTKGLLSDIAKFINLKQPVLIEGETGVGKTSAFRYLAHLTQNPYRRLNLNGSTTVDEFVGHITLDEKGTNWVDGVLIDAMRKGHWLVLDEINAALPEILFVLHSLLDDDGYVVLAEKDGEVVRPHDNFRVFATMNPSDGQYSGTKELNTAFLDRFVKMTIDFPTLAQERTMVEKRYPKMTYVTKDRLTNMLRYVGEMRTAYQNGAQEFLISPRGVLQWVRLSEEFKDIQKAAEYSLVLKAPAEERNAIRDVLKLKFGMGIADYIPQCKVNNRYEVGDEVVVSISADNDTSLSMDFVGLYEVKEVDAPPLRDGETEVDRSRIVYTLKCKAKNNRNVDHVLKNGDRVRLGQLPTVKYLGDTGLMG